MRPYFRFVLALLTAALMSAAVADTPAADRVTTLSRDAILSDPSLLPANGDLSTGQPDGAVLKIVADAGFAAVIDLRGVDEDRGIDEQAAVEALGMRYVSLPIPSPASATFENAARLEAILAEIDGPVLMHCLSGNRVGSLFALSASANGASSDEALAIGKAAGLTRWEDSIRQQLESDAK